MKLEGGDKMTTVSDIRNWLYAGKDKGNTHMIVVCDTFDYEDYPVYVKEGENIAEYVAKYQNYEQMSRVMEIYNYSMDLDEQLKPHTRCWNIEMPMTKTKK
jgi:hypothetical protein